MARTAVRHLQGDLQRAAVALIVVLAGTLVGALCESAWLALRAGAEDWPVAAAGVQGAGAGGGALFLESLSRSRERFGAALDALRAGWLALPNVNLDTGRRAAPGEYPLADETARQLADRLRRGAAKTSNGDATSGPASAGASR